MITRKEKITSKAIESLEGNPDGFRYSELVRKMHQEFPDIPVNTICGGESQVYNKCDMHRGNKTVCLSKIQ